MKLRYKFATQKVGFGIVAVAIEEDSLKYSDILRMNSTGAFILEQLYDDISFAENANWKKRRQMRGIAVLCTMLIFIFLISSEFFLITSLFSV